MPPKHPDHEHHHPHGPPNWHDPCDEDSRGQFYFDVGDQTYTHDRPRITVAEVFEIIGGDPNQGLVRCMPDGTVESVDPDEPIRLVPRPRFRLRPRFKRG
ncbi:MAG: hypothetical protein AAGD18_13965 [Actinomycetota bacterium]